MPRQKLSEFRAKTILSEALELPYTGWPVNADEPLDGQLTQPAQAGGPFVVKVDEGVKGRFKKGLVALDVEASKLAEAVKEISSKGYHGVIVEPMVRHEQQAERYLSMMIDRSGLALQYSASGGVDIEANPDSIKRVKLDDETDWQQLASDTGISEPKLKKLAEVFKSDYFAFLEINPYLLEGSDLRLLDAAVEVDDAGEFFVDNWTAEDFRSHTGQGLTEEEKVVKELDANSPASLKLSVLEPNGSIFLLLSGGGASVVVADEVYNQGFGKQLANYGEYSGNPNAEETYMYTKQLLQLLLRSSAKQKVLFIGGAVANFTDVGKTFAGVIKAIDEVADQLKSQNVKVFVRRGGPNQEAGLAKMEAALAKYGLLGSVHSPDTPLTDVVTEALRELKP